MEMVAVPGNCETTSYTFDGRSIPGLSAGSLPAMQALVEGAMEPESQAR
jgi:hypothetical protein